MKASANKKREIDECWKSVGVWGNGECPELLHRHHCRDCSVYSRASRRMLDRKPPPGYVQAWTRLLAEPEEEPLPGRISVLVFRIGPEWFALPTSLFVEAVTLRPVHSIPHRNNPILVGLVNVRGEMHLCVSVGKLLGVDRDHTATQSEEERRALARMMLITLEGESLVFFVSEASGIHLYHPSEIGPLPATLPKTTSVYCKGLLHWQEHHVALLDGKMLFEKLMQRIQ